MSKPFGAATENQVILSERPVENVLYSRDRKASIVLGSDRVSNAGSGYGGLGFDDCSAIDIVCGRGKTIAAEDKENRITINPDFFSDAAEIYMSEKTDIDKNFRLADGNIGSSIASSAIALKADAIRIIGVSGIKLATRANKSNSNDVEPGVKGIELIAGNDDSSLQSMVKGENLVDCLNNLAEIISDIKAQVHSTMSFLSDFVDNYSSHVHVPPSGPSATAPAAQALFAAEYATHSAEDNSITDQISSFIIDYLEKPSHDKNILSPYNKTN